MLHRNLVCEKHQSYLTIETSEGVWQAYHERKRWQSDDCQVFRLSTFSIWMTDKEISKLPYQDIWGLSTEEADTFLEWFDKNVIIREICNDCFKEWSSTF